MAVSAMSSGGDVGDRALAPSHENRPLAAAAGLVARAGHSRPAVQARIIGPTRRLRKQTLDRSRCDRGRAAGQTAAAHPDADTHNDGAHTRRPLDPMLRTRATQSCA